MIAREGDGERAAFRIHVDRLDCRDRQVHWLCASGLGIRRHRSVQFGAMKNEC